MTLSSDRLLIGFGRIDDAFDLPRTARCRGVLGFTTVATAWWSPFHRVADTCDRVASLAACPTNRGLNLAHGLVNVTLSLQIVVAGHRADGLLDLALRLIDLLSLLKTPSSLRSLMFAALDR